MNYPTDKQVLDWKDWYQGVFLPKKYGVTDSVKVEDPRTFLCRFLRSFPDLISFEQGSAQRVKRWMMTSPLSSRGGFVFGYDPDTLRRQYDYLKSSSFDVVFYYDSLDMSDFFCSEAVI